LQPSSRSLGYSADDAKDDGTLRVEVVFTAEQAEALAELRQKLDFTPEEVEERQRRTQAALEWIAAADTLEEQQHIGGRLWAEHVEGPRATRRVETARRVAPVATRPTRPERATRIGRTKAAARTTTPARGDPAEDDDPHDGPWALTWFDRAPVLWRLRAARCRLLEIRTGVDR
jgi:hypothetical protein